MSSKKSKTAAKTAAARTRTAEAGTNGHESKFAQRQRFTSSKGDKLDVNVKQNGEGFKTYVLHKKASAGSGEKVKAVRGMSASHPTKDAAMTAYDALVADARKNGWAPAATTRRETFSSMPAAE